MRIGTCAALLAMFMLAGCGNKSDTVQTQTTPPQGSPSPEDFAKFVFADFERIGNLMKVAGIKPE